MTCEQVPVPGGVAIICSRGGGGNRVCDVCDLPVKKADAATEWRGRTIDLCPRCKTQYGQDPGFVEWADRIIAKHYPTARR
jgi:hypothetical protein